MNTKGYAKLIRSAGSSIIELNIQSGEKTPWHYHTLFSETFEVLKGTLEVGQGEEIIELKAGDKATIEPNEKHYYHNVSGEKGVITTTTDPANKNFEHAMFILKGLANDGLASVSGTPNKFSDL